MKNKVIKRVNLAVDGVWQGESSSGAGNYNSETSWAMRVGIRPDVNANYLIGSCGWIRLHNHLHYTPGTDFVSSFVFPGIDANTIEAWKLEEGVRTTATAEVNSPTNDGTIYNGTWVSDWIYPDLLLQTADNVVLTQNYVLTVQNAQQLQTSDNITLLSHVGIIVNIDHETGDLNQYAWTVTDGGDLSVTTAAGLAGTGYGLSCLINDTNALYGTAEIDLSSTDKVRYRFSINPNGLSRPGRARRR